MPWTDLHSAAGENDVEEIRSLLGKRADIDAKDNAGLVPLHIAAGEGSSEAVKCLCENGADVNMKTTHGDLTALHLVVEEGHNECLEVLVAARADVNAKSKDGYTALHEAARFGYVFTTQLLIESNAEVNAECEKGQTPLHLGLQFNHPEVLAALVAAGGNIHHRDKYTICPCDLCETEEMQRAIGMFKSIVMLENTSEFVLKVVDRIEKETGTKLRSGKQAVEYARFFTLFNFKEFLTFIDRRKVADKRLAEIRKKDLENDEWKGKYLGSYYNTSKVMSADIRTDHYAQTFIHTTIIKKFPPPEEPPLETPTAK